MRVDRRLPVVLAVMVTLGVLMLGIGRNSAKLPSVAIAAALMSTVGVDFKHWIRLHRWVANLGAAACVTYFLWNFFHVDQETQLLNIADLLVYLQVILLFQEKNERVYWQVAILSLLQIVISSAMTTSAMFGLLMIGYGTIGLIFLWLLHWYRSEQAAIALGGDVRIMTVAQGARPQLPPAPNAAASPPSGHSFLPLPSWSTVSGWLLGATVVSAALFVFLPRARQSTADEIGHAQQRVTGYSETIQLGALGETIENSEIVMRVTFSDPNNDAPYLVAGSPLFRGSLLTKYESPGHWTDPRGLETGAAHSVSAFSPSESPGYVLQNIQLEPLREQVVFSVFPPVATGAFDAMRLAPDRVRLVPFHVDRKKMVRHSLGTLGIHAHQVREIVPLVESSARARNLVQLPRLPNGDDPLPELKATARRIVESAGLAPNDRVGLARGLVRHFHDAQRYRYSLRGQNRDTSLDPIEDFVRNHPVGHCEYFASALCLMLRSQNVPSRVVIGFRGEWNPLTEDFVVRQFHAHAWVEAYLEPDQLPADATENWPKGAA